MACCLPRCNDMCGVWKLISTLFMLVFLTFVGGYIDKLLWFWLVWNDGKQLTLEDWERLAKEHPDWADPSQPEHWLYGLPFTVVVVSVALCIGLLLRAAGCIAKEACSLFCCCGEKRHKVRRHRLRRRDYERAYAEDREFGYTEAPVALRAVNGHSTRVSVRAKSQSPPPAKERGRGVGKTVYPVWDM